MLRWRVVVDTTTGQHTLDKTYPPRRRAGDLEEATPRWDRDYLWLLRPPEDSTEPSRSDVEAALSEVARDGERLTSAVSEYKNRVRDALLRNDRELEAKSQVAPDAALSEPLRERLFAIRGHLGGAPSVLQAERIVTTAIDQVETSQRKLEALAAWGNLRNTRKTSSRWRRLPSTSSPDTNGCPSTSPSPSNSVSVAFADRKCSTQTDV